MIRRDAAETPSNNNLLFLAILAALLLAPFGYAAIAGQGQSATAGPGVVEIALCGKGQAATSLILLAETGLVTAATFVAYALKGNSNRLVNALRQNGAILAVLLVLVAIPFLIAWQTQSPVCERGKSYFWQSVFIEVFILAALAISYNLMFGFAGVISFGHAAFFGIGAYTAGLLMLHLNWPLLAAVLAALATSVLMGLVVSVIALRIRGLYFAIFTLAFAEIFYVLAQNRIMSGITGAEDGFTFNVPDWINVTRNRLTFYYLALAFLVICYLVVRQVINSPTGRVMRAIRDNEDRAMALGYNTFAFKTLAIVLASLMATSAGVLRGLLNKGASPNVLGIDFTMNPLLMTLVGGAGTFNGPVIGAFLLQLVEQSLRDTILHLGALEFNVGERWALILGLLFIVIVIAFPSGISGTIQNYWVRWRSRRNKGQAS